MLTRMSSLLSIEKGEAGEGTSMQALTVPTGANLISLNYSVPSTQSCVTTFQTLRTKFKAPFRITLTGRIIDVQPIDHSQQGNMKRIFNIADHYGTYITCCAMKHNASSAALQNYQEAVIYYATGRGPIRHSRGMLHLYKDSMIIPLGNPSLMNHPKTEALLIE